MSCWLTALPAEWLAAAGAFIPLPWPLPWLYPSCSFPAPFRFHCQLTLFVASTGVAGDLSCSRSGSCSDLIAFSQTEERIEWGCDPTRTHNPLSPVPAAGCLFYGPVATAYCFRFASMMATCASVGALSHSESRCRCQCLCPLFSSTTLCCLRAKFLSAPLVAS